MPEVKPVLHTLPEDILLDSERFLVDVKVHMLMPGQWPCIPNWHTDFCPRNEKGIKVLSERDPKYRMYMWLSGPPFTEFKDGREVIPETWIEFNQFDEHRGTQATEHGWRMFVRVAPVEIAPNYPPEMWIRRHSQVYLDSETFNW